MRSRSWGAPKKLLAQVRDAIRLKHYAYRTEETYVQWIRRYIRLHNKRHPKEMGKAEIEGLRLRVKDVDFAQQQIVVRDGKGSKSRVS